MNIIIYIILSMIGWTGVQYFSNSNFFILELSVLFLVGISYLHGLLHGEKDDRM